MANNHHDTFKVGPGNSVTNGVVFLPPMFFRVKSNQRHFASMYFAANLYEIYI